MDNVDFMRNFAESKLKCNCGATAKYIFDLKKVSCNKYAPCPTYEEVRNQLGMKNAEFYSQHYNNIRNVAFEECATLAENLKEDRSGKMPIFQVADEIRKLKVTK